VSYISLTLIDFNQPQDMRLDDGKDSVNMLFGPSFLSSSCSSWRQLKYFLHSPPFQLHDDENRPRRKALIKQLLQ